jgi:peptide-methionine (R)-S-oxide reductase
MNKGSDFIWSLIIVAAMSFLILYNVVVPFFFPREGTPFGEKKAAIPSPKYVLSEIEWRAKLTARQYEVMRENKMEPPFSGIYVDFTGKGVYACAGCNQKLFLSDDKYDAKTGYPSFTKPIADAAIILKESPWSYQQGISVLCSNCESYVGLLFNDGLPPTNKRYSIYSIALNFIPAEKTK